MSFITKPKVAHPGLPRNDLGLTYRAYEGGMSTLCAGCGHDSVTAAMIQACFELSLSPQGVVKLALLGDRVEHDGEPVHLRGSQRIAGNHGKVFPSHPFPSGDDSSPERIQKPDRIPSLSLQDRL